MSDILATLTLLLLLTLLAIGAIAMIGGDTDDDH
jgi:hypothetical protein